MNTADIDCIDVTTHIKVAKYEATLMLEQSTDRKYDRNGSMAQELGYADLVEATITCLMNESDLIPSKEEGDAREDATTISGITEIRRKTDQ